MGDQAGADALEARYMQIVNSYKEKDYIRTVWLQLRELGETVMEQGGCDFLGVIAGELNALDAGQGQFFTPFAVSRMMAEIQLHDMPAYVAKHGYFTLGEPAAGSGGMVIAAADVLQGLGCNPMFDMLVETWDINHLAYWMCFLQLTWRGITARCVRGNSLSQQEFESAWTPMIFLFHARHGSLFNRPRAIADVIEDVVALERDAKNEAPVEVIEVQPEVVEPEPEAPAEIPVGKPVQLSLF